MIQVGQQGLIFPTAVEWKGWLENNVVRAPIQLTYNDDKAKAQGNVRPAQLINLLAEVFALELPEIEQVTVNEIPETDGTVTAVPIGKTVFSAGYPDVLMEELSRADNTTVPLSVLGNYVTYELREPITMLAGLSGPMVEGTREQRPRVRGHAYGPNGEILEIQGQKHYYEMSLTCWSRSTKIVEFLADLVQDVMSLYTGWLTSKGVCQISYASRTSLGGITSQDLLSRPKLIRLPNRVLTYLVVLDRQYVIRKPLITKIDVGVDSIQ
jgi:hypothetical protein